MQKNISPRRKESISPKSQRRSRKGRRSAMASLTPLRRRSPERRRRGPQRRRRNPQRRRRSLQRRRRSPQRRRRSPQRRKSHPSPPSPVAHAPGENGPRENAKKCKNLCKYKWCPPDVGALQNMSYVLLGIASSCVASSSF